MRELQSAKRAAHPDGWQSITYRGRGTDVTRDDKTFLALSHLADKLIRVVLVRFEDGGGVPYFCTEPNATVRDMLETASDRWAIEEHFHDVKEVWVAGQQQVRHVWSNIGCWHLNQWLHTLVELASWDEPPSALVNRPPVGQRQPPPVSRRPPPHNRRGNTAHRISLSSTRNPRNEQISRPRRIPHHTLRMTNGDRLTAC